MILTAAADLVDARDEDGYTPLHLAVIAGNKPLIKFLLSKNADVNSLDYERHSVVHWATGKSDSVLRGKPQIKVSNPNYS
jgi:ankyrin repeat protein